jgi:hypothetical protein
MNEDNHRLAFSHQKRFSHWYLIGTTGSGKTTLLKNILLDDMRRGHGLCFIDLHGDAPHELLANIPRDRLQDVIYYDPTSYFCPAFNILKLPYAPDKIVGDIVSILEMFSKGSWGPRLNDILTGVLTTLVYDMIDNGTSRTFLDVRYFLLNPDFRANIVQAIKRPSVREFWELDYPTLNRQEIAPVLNKLNQLLKPESLIRRVFSEPDNELNFREIMDKKKILLVRLAAGGDLGEENANILGSVIIHCIQQAAKSRENIPEDDRIPFFLAVDEFENFTPKPFQAFLAETRKYKVYLTLSHQLLLQTTTELKEHIFTLAKVWFAFQISDKDAHEIQRGMHRTREILYHRHEPFPSSLTPQFLVESERDRFAAELQQVLGEKKACEARYMRILEAHWSGGNTGNNPDYIPMPKHMQQRLDVEQKEYDKLLKQESEAKRSLETLSRSAISHSTFYEFFKDYELRKETYPSVDDLTGLKPFHAFCRLDTPDNVEPFTTLPTPPPDESIRQAILAEHKHRHAARIARRNLKEQAQPSPAPTPTPGTNPTPRPKSKPKKPKADPEFLDPT